MKLIQQKLKELKLDAYIIYDLRGSNPIGRDILNFHSHTTRKFVSIITPEEALHIVPKIEQISFSELEGRILTYVSHAEFRSTLKQSIQGLKTVALDISIDNNLPILDLVPHGFVSLLLELNPGLELVSSQPFVSEHTSRWGEAGYKSHKQAAELIEKIFEESFRFIEESIESKKPTSDYDVANFILDKQKAYGLHTDGENICIVATNQRTKNPHYFPTEEENHPIELNNLLLIDIWAREVGDPNNIYADMTQLAWIGPDEVPKNIQAIWQTYQQAIDAGLEILEDKVKEGIAGYEVCRTIQDSLEKSGYSQEVLLHRSGHSLGTKEHSNGANIDDLETHDTRLIMPDTGLTIEPGLYFEDFGIRSEFDVYIHPNYRVETTTPRQKEIRLLNRK